MTNVHEEYKINRLRGLTQMVYLETRQAGRSQPPWIQRKLLKDLGRETPHMEIVKEMQTIIKENLKMHVEQTGERYQPWRTQQGEVETHAPQRKKRCIVDKQGSMKVVNMRVREAMVPSHLVR